MAENRRFYYLKLKEGFYNSETMVVLESMPDGLLYSNLLLKMYLMSLKSGGILMLNEHLPPWRGQSRFSWNLALWKS